MWVYTRGSMKVTEKEIEKLCKEKGCYCPPYEQILTEYANTPEYLRLFIKIYDQNKILKKEK